MSVWWGDDWCDCDGGGSRRVARERVCDDLRRCRGRDRHPTTSEACTHKCRSARPSCGARSTAEEADGDEDEDKGDADADEDDEDDWKVS